MTEYISAKIIVVKVTFWRKNLFQVKSIVKSKFSNIVLSTGVDTSEANVYKVAFGVSLIEIREAS